MNDASVRELMSRIAQGDQAAMRALYELYCKPLASFVRGRGLTAQAAEECVHDTMLEVWRNAGRYKGSASVKTWVYSIARNKAIDMLRKSQRETGEEPPEEIDLSPNPEAAAIAAQSAARVRYCLDQLSAAHKTIVRLAFFEDLSYEDISAVEAIPLGTIKSRIFHAKKLLMNCLSTA